MKILLRFLFFSLMAPRHLVGQDLLIFEVSRLHSDTLGYVGLLWTG